MIIHPKFIFAHMPRCGGNYVSKFLQENIGQCKRTQKAHIGISDISEEDRSKPSFCTIRNPFDWYVSWWAYSMKSSDSRLRKLYEDGRDKDFNKWLKYMLTKNSDRTPWFDFGTMARLDIGLMSFKFVRIMMDRPRLFSRNKPLNINPIDFLLVDYFVRLENVNTNIADVFEKYIFPLDDKQQLNLISIGKVNTSDHKKYIDYYNEESIELVLHKDRIIFEMLNYKFGD